MVYEHDSFVKLRKKIRQSGIQFRRNNDNSKSIFYPAGGFAYAYDMTIVEHALNEYELSLPTEYREEHSTLTLEEKLIKEAHYICATNPSMDIRDFARSVAAYLVMNSDPDKKKNPLGLLTMQDLEPLNDTLDD